MNKYTLFVLFLVITNVLIFVFVDSIYCSVDWFLIAFGLILQLVSTFVLLTNNLPKYKDLDSKRKFSKEEVIIFIFLCFGLTYNGNLGVDKTGRTTDCPNTWLQYLKE